MTGDVLKVKMCGACRNAVLCRSVETNNTLLRILGILNNLCDEIVLLIAIPYSSSSVVSSASSLQ